MEDGCQGSGPTHSPPHSCAAESEVAGSERPEPEGAESEESERAQTWAWQAGAEDK